MTTFRALTLLSAIIASPLTVAAQVPRDAGASLDAIFERWDSRESPGCAVGVRHADSHMLTRAYGMADLEHDVPNSPETIFEAGSVSKQFTATAVVLLSLAGKLSLDDDVRTHVPELPDYGETITIRHLLNHTSGLRDWGNVARISGWGRSERTHDNDHVLDILSRQQALNHRPGDEFSYTNSGYNLLAAIVDRVSGMSFTDFSKQRIFEPLGMNSTQWRDDYRRIVKGRASAYSTRDDEFIINRPIEHVHGPGGLLTTVSDLLTWNESLEDGSLAGPELVDIMHEQGVLDDGSKIDYAAGLQIGTHNGVPSVRHGGDTAGYRAYLARFPTEDLSVALLCNVSNADPGALAGSVADIFLPETAVADDDGAVEPPRRADVPESELRSKEGVYYNAATGVPVSFVFVDGVLRLEGGNEPNELIPLSPTEFQVGDDTLRFASKAAPGASRPSFTETTDGGDEVYLPADEFAPSLADLAGFAGTYLSSEAETRFVLEIDDSELVIRRRPDRRGRLRPVYRDAFESPIGLIRFHRNDAGEVTSFGLRVARVFDMRFFRIDE